MLWRASRLGIRSLRVPLLAATSAVGDRWGLQTTAVPLLSISWHVDGFPERLNVYVCGAYHLTDTVSEEVRAFEVVNRLGFEAKLQPLCDHWGVS